MCKNIMKAQKMKPCCNDCSTVWNLIVSITVLSYWFSNLLYTTLNYRLWSQCTLYALCDWLVKHGSGANSENDIRIFTYVTMIMDVCSASSMVTREP